MWKVDVYYGGNGSTRYLCSAKDFPGVLEMLERAEIDFSKVERVERLVEGLLGLWVTPGHE